MWQFHSAPADVPNELLWRTGQPGDLAVGDLWLLSWDARPLALALISGVASDFTLAWPVTLPSNVAFRPAVEIPTSPLGTRVHIWPSRETGIGLHLFHRRFGTLLPEETMAMILEAVELGKEPPYPYAPSKEDDPKTDSLDDTMVDKWEAICFNVWPTPVPGHTPLNRDLLRASEIRPGDIADVLNVSTPDAVSLFMGETYPTDSQVEALTARWKIDPDELLRTHVDEAAVELLRPVWKDDLVKIGLRYDEGEGAARQRLREEFALAARSGGSTRDLMQAAVGRLLRN